MSAERLHARRVESERMRTKAASVALPLLVIAVGLASLTVGRFDTPVHRVVPILLSRVLPLDIPIDDVQRNVVELVRLPRVLTAMLVGGGLATAGAALQGIFGNPLVSAHILGVSSGAAFGGVLAIVLAAGSVVFVGSAVGFGMLAIVVVYAVSRVGGRAPPLMLVLSGVIVGAFFSAGISVLTYLADPYDALPTIVFWLMGSMAAASWSKVALIAVPVFLGGGLLFLLRWRINVLSLGDVEASALGMRVEPLRWACLLATAVIVAGTVAVSGIVGWVGLVVPHLARMIVGPDHRRLIPASFLLGAAFLTLMDDLARGLTPAEIPIGIITALVGAPVFLVLMRRAKGTGWTGE